MLTRHTANRITIENDISKKSIEIELLDHKLHIRLRWYKKNISYLYYKSGEQYAILKNIWRDPTYTIYDFMIGIIYIPPDRREMARYKFISIANDSFYSFLRGYSETDICTIFIDDTEMTKQERIELMGKELLFYKRRKELTEAVKIYKENRRKRILEEGQKYLIPELCNMIVEMVQN